MPNGSEAIRFALIVVAGVSALALSSAYIPILAAILASIPIAVCVARRARETAALFLAVALAAGIAGPGLVMAAGLGALTGLGIRLGLTYTRIVFVVSLIIFALNAVIVAVMWDQTVEDFEQVHAEVGRMIEEAESADASEQVLANYRARQWLLEDWQTKIPGIGFTGILFATCLIVGAVGKWRLRRDNVGIRATFLEYRPADWLVWVLIAVALMWFIDQRWQVSGFRVVSWNLAFALAGIYWVNGLAVFVYGVSAWKPNIFLMVALVLALVYGLMPMLAVIGLFDTWGEFRPRIDALIAARNARKDSYDDVA